MSLQREITLKISKKMEKKISLSFLKRTLVGIMREKCVMALKKATVFSFWKTEISTKVSGFKI